MSGLSGGKTVKPPPVPIVPPAPTVDTAEAEAGARKERPRGREKTFITGDLEPDTKKKKVLG